MLTITRDFAIAEIKRAISQMGAYKALGSDGYQLIF